MDRTFNFSRDFPQNLAIGLLRRLELGARQEAQDEESLSSSLAWGWGRFLHLPDRSSTGQIGTFGTCDALRTIERIQTISKVYHRGSRAVPSERLQGIYHGAQQLMLTRCAQFLDKLDHGAEVISAPRLAALLSTIARTMAPNHDLLVRVIATLGTTGISLTDSPESIGWPWNLSIQPAGGSAEVGPTALLLDALVAIEPWLRSSNSTALAQAVFLVDSSANYLCSKFESKYPRSIEELVVCMPALRAYEERAVPTRESLRRRTAVVCAKHQILAEDFFKAFVSQADLRSVTLKSQDSDNRATPQPKDATYDVFLHGPLISTFLISPNPSHRELASVVLRQALTALGSATDAGEHISTHWLASIVDALPTSVDIVLQKQEPFAPFQRFVTVPNNRMTFLILSDTQFGRDSTANRPPLPGLDSFEEVKPATFEQLVRDAARKLADTGVGPLEWSGLLHLGDVVCRGDYRAQEGNAINALRDSTAILGVPPNSLVISPGNHDLVRSSLVDNLPRILGRTSASSDPVNLGRELIVALRQELSCPVLAQPGFGCFRDMYSRLVERQVVVSEGGVEVVSFLAPRIIVHVVSLWPAVRHRIGACPKGGRNEQYGLPSRAHNDVREFLKTTSSNDIVILLSHVPPEHLNVWSGKDGDRDEWLGPPIAEDMASFLKFVLYETSGNATQPAIHLILSGHMQDSPILCQFDNVVTYTAGAFHLQSGISKGTFAARLSIDEGAVRIDSVGLDPYSTVGSEPTIIAIGNDRISAASYDAHVLSTYDAEAEQFIKATNVPRKYVKLEAIRERFASILTERFGDNQIRVLDIGAGAGRDADFFLSRGFHVEAVEGAPTLAAALRQRTGANGLSVHEANIVEPTGLVNALRGKSFHGVWMCATLLHIPSKTDLAYGSTLVDKEVIETLSGHLVPNGVLYVDNKLGTGAHFKERGNVLQKRWFRYRKSEELEHLTVCAGLNRIDSDWYNGTNGFDAWIWLFAEKPKL